MSAKDVVTRSALLAVVAGLGASGFLAVQGAAQADPPACAQWGFNGAIVLNGSDGSALNLNSTGADPSGPATLTGVPVVGKVDGTISGHIDKGGQVNLALTGNDGGVVNWVGDVGDDGVAHGNIPSTWVSDRKLTCAHQEQGPQQQQQQQPKQGPTVTAKPGLTGVTFTFNDRSGVASQCTYSSEGYTDSFGLPANGSADLFVPAIREFRQRTGTVTCDNGTSSPTSANF